MHARLQTDRQSQPDVWGLIPKRRIGCPDFVVRCAYTRTHTLLRWRNLNTRTILSTTTGQDKKCDISQISTCFSRCFLKKNLLLRSRDTTCTYEIFFLLALFDRDLSGEFLIELDLGSTRPWDHDGGQKFHFTSVFSSRIELAGGMRADDDGEIEKTIAKKLQTIEKITRLASFSRSSKGRRSDRRRAKKEQKKSEKKKNVIASIITLTWITSLFSRPARIVRGFTRSPATILKSSANYANCRANPQKKLLD